MEGRVCARLLLCVRYGEGMGRSGTISNSCSARFRAVEGQDMGHLRTIITGVFTAIACRGA